MRWLPFVLLLVACNPPEAPAELSELGRYFVREFDNADPAFLAVGADSLVELFAEVDFDAATLDRSTIPTHLEPEDVEGLVRPPDTDLQNSTDVTLYYRSTHPVSAHAAFTVEADQAPAEVSTPEYTRTFLEGDDCFASGDCDLLRTTNDVFRENPMFSLRFELLKDFRWSETSDGEAVLVSRAWTEQTFAAEVGTADLRQSWTLDVFIDSGAGCDRLRVNWAETVFDPQIGEDIQRNSTRSSMQDAMELADEALDQRSSG